MVVVAAAADEDDGVVPVVGGADGAVRATMSVIVTDSMCMCSELACWLSWSRELMPASLIVVQLEWLTSINRMVTLIICLI